VPPCAAPPAMRAVRACATSFTRCLTAGAAASEIWGPSRPANLSGCQRMSSSRNRALMSAGPCFAPRTTHVKNCAGMPVPTHIPRKYGSGSCRFNPGGGELCNCVKKEDAFEQRRSILIKNAVGTIQSSGFPALLCMPSKATNVQCDQRARR